MKPLNKDHYLSIFYIALGALILYLTSRITSLFSVDTNDLGPKFFPSLCGIGIILCGIGKFLTSAKNTPKKFLHDKKDYIRLAVLWLILLVYVISIKYVGYMLSSFVLMFIMSTLLADEHKPKVWQRLLFSLIMVALTYCLFHFVIKINLPQGQWIKALIKAVGR